MQTAVATPSASPFSYRVFTVKELTDAINAVYKKQAEKKPAFQVYPMGEGIYNAIQRAIDAEWEILTAKQEPCPNCPETMINDHCPYCDYPYNNK